MEGWTIYQNDENRNHHFQFFSSNWLSINFHLNFLLSNFFLSSQLRFIFCSQALWKLSNNFNFKWQTRVEAARNEQTLSENRPHCVKNMRHVTYRRMFPIIYIDYKHKLPFMHTIIIVNMLKLCNCFLKSQKRNELKSKFYFFGSNGVFI